MTRIQDRMIELKKRDTVAQFAGTGEIKSLDTEVLTNGAVLLIVEVGKPSDDGTTLELFRVTRIWRIGRRGSVKEVK